MHSKIGNIVHMDDDTISTAETPSKNKAINSNRNKQFAPNLNSVKIAKKKPCTPRRPGAKLPYPYQCYCVPLKQRFPEITKCGYCQTHDQRPARVLPLERSIFYCSDCSSYSEDRRTWIQAGRESKELLDFLLRILRLNSYELIREKLDFIGASFVTKQPRSPNMGIRLAFRKRSTQQEIFQHMNFRVHRQTCRVCLRKDLTPGSWSTMVQLRQYGSHNQSRLNLEHAILNNAVFAALIMRFKQMDHGSYFFFRTEKLAIVFCRYLSVFSPIKKEEIQKIDSLSSESCITIWVCPICVHDLVYLPPQVSTSLGNLGPLVICHRLRSGISLKDPFTLRTCILSAADYWKAPFEPLMTTKDFVEFVVMDVENSPSGTNNSSVPIQVARVSEFGKNDKSFALRSHVLCQNLKRGDFVFGYDMLEANINNMEVEKLRDPQQLDLVLVIKKDDWILRSEKAAAMEEKSPEYQYQEFLKDLDKNSEAMFNLSLDSGDDENPSLKSYSHSLNLNFTAQCNISTSSNLKLTDLN